jgi:hypothetical protein
MQVNKSEVKPIVESTVVADFYEEESEYNIVPFVCESSKPKINNESLKMNRGGKRKMNDFLYSRNDS